MLAGLRIFKSCLRFFKTVGELEGIDFDAFFDCDNFSHQQAVIANYLDHRQTRTSKMRDANADLNMPVRRGQCLFQWIFRIKIEKMI